LRGVLGDWAAVRDHHRDRITDVAGLVAHQHERGDVLPQATAGEPDDLAHRLAQRRSLGAQVRHQIVERENPMHARGRACRVRVDAVDGRVGVRRAHEHRRQRARQSDVVDEAAFASQQRRVLDPDRSGAEAFP
jgi:hypothetical protein